MKKKKIHFQMINDTETTSFEAKGSFEDHKLSFIDQENQKNYIVFKDSKVEYVKMGNRFMHYTFEQSKISNGMYRVDGFEFDFQIDTTYLEYSKEYLHVHFTLRQTDEVVGHHQLMITFKDDKED